VQGTVCGCFDDPDNAKLDGYLRRKLASTYTEWLAMDIVSEL
jgi:hypothetical protein